jgi:hypothetical protein
MCSIVYSMTPQKIYLFSAHEYRYSKNAKFYADFKSVEIIGNK